MSERSRASVEDDEVEAGSGSANSLKDETRPSSEVPAHRRHGSAEESEGHAEESEKALESVPTGKRARNQRGRPSSEDGLKERSTATSTAREGKKAKRGVAARSRNPFALIVQFIREVISELSKVIWPHRRQMVSYTVIVVIFVAVVVSFVAGLDVGFAKLALWLLG